MNELDKMLEASPESTFEDLEFTLSTSIYEAHKHLLKDDSYKGIHVETDNRMENGMAVLHHGNIGYK